MPHYADRKDLFPMQGGCPCGHIRYQINLPPLIVQTCHCTLCQRQIGSAFAINAIIESSAITLLPSAPLTTPPSKADAAQASSSPAVCGVLPAFADFTNAATTATVPPQSTSSTTAASASAAPNSPILVTIPTQSKVGQTVAQCPLCRGSLWNYYADGGLFMTYLITSTLDRPWELEPDVHIFTRSKRDFITINDGKPQFEGQYPDRSVFFRPDCKARVDALLEKQVAWRKQLKAAYKAQFAKI
ncbi:glutathione-dependent formaldehyde-activating enzyme domain-containing protein [Trichoderma breve]|uniref:Glutathione-dependent formaldehyde-activating enzyme domain-containing protein n=1 Tax=Trichoderma breve TaxID=2034170 RepID=A0A9W9JQS4_9HYPO|nr:glutathione-dependent formaldehyde-activating enzyme domain-containing protein [Trichoderma breve]KAJ4864313.1 glutathione-dependent formaldehyde-activating enzyme domain-containing protein [Trichoderma breve]